MCDPILTNQIQSPVPQWFPEVPLVPQGGTQFHSMGRSNIAFSPGTQGDPEMLRVATKSAPEAAKGETKTAKGFPNIFEGIEKDGRQRLEAS